VDGIPVLQKESLIIPSEASLLKRCFGLETEWDNPANNTVGPKEAGMSIVLSPIPSLVGLQLDLGLDRGLSVNPSRSL
jgi:hypothetical protein